MQNAIDPIAYLTAVGEAESEAGKSPAAWLRGCGQLGLRPKRKRDRRPEQHQGSGRQAAGMEARRGFPLARRMESSAAGVSASGSASGQKAKRPLERRL